MLGRWCCVRAGCAVGIGGAQDGCAVADRPAWKAHVVAASRKVHLASSADSNASIFSVWTEGVHGYMHAH